MRIFTLYLFFLAAMCGAQRLSAQDCDHPDFAPLMALYESTNGDDWTDNTGWYDGTAATSCDPCNEDLPWRGVSCSSGRVHQFDLSSNGLSGVLPELIGGLTELEELRISNNNLIGSIPSSIGQLMKLRAFYGEGNQLNGEIPVSFANLPMLRRVFLRQNQFEGNLPRFVSSNLNAVALSHNYFSGEIPECYTALENLTFLWVSNNNLSGQIPLGFGEQPLLATISFRANNLSGCIPDDLNRFCEDYPFFRAYFDGNPLLPNEGSFPAFCSEAPQIGAPCDDGIPDNGPDVINEDCSCGDYVPPVNVNGNISLPYCTAGTLEGLISPQVLANAVSFPVNSDGDYHTVNYETPVSVRVDPNSLPGVAMANINTPDLVAIARHILGFASFDAAWQFQAANVNLNETGSQAVNVVDIITIRRYMLELVDGFPDHPNTGWYATVVGSQASNDNFTMTLSTEVSPTLEEAAVVDFLAIELGNVSDDCSTPEEGASYPALFSLKNQPLKKGETIKLPITVKDFSKLSVLDFGFQYDTKAISINAVGSGDLKMEKDNTHRIDSKLGTVRGIWVPEDIKIATAPREKPFDFFLEITAFQDVKRLSDVIGLLKGEEHNRIYPLEKGKPSNQLVVKKSAVANSPTIQWLEGAEPVAPASIFTTLAAPNPFGEDLMLTITSPESQAATIQLFSLTSQTTAEQTAELSAGENRVMLRGLGHLAPGVYGYRVINASGRAVTGKVVKR